MLYEWDWDSDGVYDESTTEPVITHTWFAEHDGPIVLRVTDNDGVTDIDTAQVTVEAVPGDLDRDGDIDRDDYLIFRSTLGKREGDPGYIPDADYDGDGRITYADYRIWYGYYRAG